MDDLMKEIAANVTAECYDVKKMLVEDVLYTMLLPKKDSHFMQGVNTVIEYSVNDIRYAMYASTDLDELLPLFQGLRDKDERVYRAVDLYHKMQMSGQFEFTMIGFDKNKKKPYVYGEPK